ncbi:XkdX family protein [Mesobacillus subterraneus]|nr:XkdX family protein [Mesobacillus subterraneus]WLR53544.1 XkdX family protein [Mesobacillus subterraneus]
MDWFKIALNDWSIYNDPSRIRKYVDFGKITQAQFTEITGESYS